ncbi:von Willebrand factor A domain-containing protein 7-like [Ylistrum balloti]|uniref:von Willebrand factor A domain-containing protein 7-like n=1 Tax=Ylistrum balloti TaxID=509963 RepID=UPI0029059084|nr:von Willebrand factor A domain-containing protein 7-like [Ylistrum balloti]
MDYSRYKWIQAAILLIFAVQVICFLPSRNIDTLSDTITHLEITREGISKAVANFLIDRRLVNGTFWEFYDVLDAYFGSDTDRNEKFNERIKDLTARLHSVQRNKGVMAMYTVNGERIEDAFNLLIRLSAQIRILTSVEPFSTDKQQSTLNLLAEALFVIQSFYSNTNWVESNGATLCPAFGGNSIQIPTVARYNDPTCSDCDTSSRECRNNIITSFLTSGYKPGQDVSLPSSRSLTGLKCAHGWNKERELAVGGISKETSDVTSSPHAHLHFQAAEASILATETYLYKNGEGILSDLTVDNFKQLMDLNSLQAVSRASLTFVIDVSGSMGNDIRKVTEECISLVTGVQGTNNEPANYVLATFTDPEVLTTGTVATSGDEMINQLRDLSVTGGGDCPEYAMSGILKGIFLSRRGSTLYVFTDADAKDGNIFMNVINAANSKDITVNFLLTGTCGRRHRRTARVRREVGDAFRKVAEGTGGQVFMTYTSVLTNTLSKVIADEMPSSGIVVQTFHMSFNDSDRKVVIIDSTMDLFKLEISGSASVNDVDVEDPTGTILRYKAGVASRHYSGGKVIISVQNPLPGNWTILRKKNQLLAVNVTGSSVFDFSVQITELDDAGSSYFVYGSPISGNNYTIALQLYNLDVNSSVTSMILVNLAGNEIERIKTVLRQTGVDMYVIADVIMPPESFRVQLTGVLPEGDSFQRTNLQVISPVNVKLILLPNLDDFPLNEPQNITYQLNNHGSTNQTFEVDINTESVRQPTVTYDMNPGEVIEDYFQITGYTHYEITTYTVSVRQLGSSIILQSLSDTVLFVSPVCEISYNEGACPELVDPPATCRSITWFSRAVLSPDVTSLELSTNHSSVEIVTDNSTDDGTNLKYINVSGDCCTPSVYLSNIGSNGHVIGQCHFNFGSFPTITNVSIILTTTTATSDMTSTDISIELKIGLIAVSVGAVLIILTYLLWCAKTEESKSNDPQNKKTLQQEQDVLLLKFIPLKTETK